MILACLSHLVVVYCTQTGTLVHNLETGKQFTFDNSYKYQTAITTVDIEKSEMLYPGNPNLTKKQGLCGCDEGQPFFEAAEDE